MRSSDEQRRGDRIKVIGKGLRRALNSKKRETGRVENQDGAAQAINNPVSIERQQTRSRTNHDVARDPDKGSRSLDR